MDFKVLLKKKSLERKIVKGYNHSERKIFKIVKCGLKNDGSLILLDKYLNLETSIIEKNIFNDNFKIFNILKNEIELKPNDPKLKLKINNILTQFPNMPEEKNELELTENEKLFIKIKNDVKKL